MKISFSVWWRTFERSVGFSHSLILVASRISPFIRFITSFWGFPKQHKIRNIQSVITWKLHWSQNKWNLQIFKESKKEEGKIAHVIEREVHKSYVDKLPSNRSGEKCKVKSKSFQRFPRTTEKREKIELRKNRVDGFQSGWNVVFMILIAPENNFSVFSVAENSRKKWALIGLWCWTLVCFNFCDIFLRKLTFVFCQKWNSVRR